MRDVFFLGAGASAADNAPTQNSLMGEYWNRTGDEVWHVDGDIKERLEAFLINFYGFDPGAYENFEYPTFEEALGFLDMALDRQEWVPRYGDEGQRVSLSQLREDLVFLIALTLDRKLGRPVGRHHAALINRLEDGDHLTSTAFVSLNYDILIDNALLDGATPRMIDYGVDIPIHENAGFQLPEGVQEVTLLKPHGSLNWLFCPVCISLTQTPRQKGVVDIAFGGRLCPDCKERLSYLIIPPTPLKAMNNIFLQQIWHELEELLIQGERIIFCGYSMPQADIHIKYILKRAEMRRQATPEIVVVNNHNEKDEASQNGEESRYKRLFKDKTCVNYTELSFQDFALDGLPG